MSFESHGGETQTGKLSPKRLSRVLDFIERHVGEDIGLSDLAAAAHLSPFHFARSFKASTGQSPLRYLADRRLDLAKSLIAEGEIPLAEIALICNFSSQANFTRAFTRAMGMSPGQYRTRWTALPLSLSA